MTRSPLRSRGVAFDADKVAKRLSRRPRQIFKDSSTNAPLIFGLARARHRAETAMSDGRNSTPQSTEVEMVEAKETWREAKLPDGTKLRIKPALIAAFR